MKKAKWPIILLPQNQKKVAHIKRKLAEYKALKQNPRNYKAPEMQMFLVCTIALLEEILKKRKIVGWSLIRRLEKTYGGGFRFWAYGYAVLAVDKYCSLGTALPKFTLDAADPFWETYGDPFAKAA